MGSSDITNVYAALDRTHTVVALERSRRGDEGFRTFFDEFADYAANKGYIPYLLLLNFHVDDGSRLPPIEAKERGYRLAHLAPLEVKDIRQALMLYDLLYCRKHGLDPLAAQNTARNLCYKDAYAGFRNESIPALSQPGAPYGAVETEGGVALFRRGERGDEAARSFFAFLPHIPTAEDSPAGSKLCAYTMWNSPRSNTPRRRACRISTTGRCASCRAIADVATACCNGAAASKSTTCGPGPRSSRPLRTPEPRHRPRRCGAC